MGRNKMTKEDFVEKSMKVHGCKYDYSDTEFLSVYEKLNIICIEHGVFNQRASNHLSGSGCPKCGRVKASNSLSSSREYVLNKFKEKHGDVYDYSLVKYINSNTPVDIVCRKHGLFNQKPSNHMIGKGCALCSKENHGVKRRYTLKKFLALLNFKWMLA